MSISSDAEDGSPDEAEHEDDSDSPCYLSIGFIELLCEAFYRQADRKEVKGISCPAAEGNLRFKVRLEVGELGRHTRKNSHCFLLMLLSMLTGFGGVFITGMRVEIRDPA